MFGPGGEFMYDSFVDLMASGFSENQSLKLIALMTAASEVFEGMPEGDIDSLHPSNYEDPEEPE